MAHKYGNGIVIRMSAAANQVEWPTGAVDEFTSGRGNNPFNRQIADDICTIAGIRADKLRHAHRRQRKGHRVGEAA